MVYIVNFDMIITGMKSDDDDEYLIRYDMIQ